MNSEQKIWTVSSIKAACKCSGFKRDNKQSVFALEKGSIIHEMLEYNCNYELCDFSGSTYRGTFREYKEKHDLDEYKEIAEKTMSRFPEFFTEDWDVEQQIDSEEANYMLSGICDRVRKTGSAIEVVDWKSGRSRADKRSELDILQAIIYAYILISKNPSCSRVVFSFVYVEAEDSEKPLTLTFDNNFQLKARLQSIIQKWVHLAEWKGYESGRHCQYCQNRNTCSMLAENIDKYTKLEDIDMQTTKSLQKVLKQRIEDIKEKWLEQRDLSKFSVSTEYFLDKESLTESELDKVFSLFKENAIASVSMKKGKVKVTKKLAEQIEELGVSLVTEETYRVKSKAN